MSTVPDGLDEALRSLPHGPEFRFLDRLTSLIPGKSGSAELLVKRHGYCVREGKTGELVFPGMLLVEAGAQLSGVVAQNDPEIEPLPRLRLTAIRNCKLLGLVRLGDTVRIEALISGRLGSLVQAEASAFVADDLVMSVELTLSGTGVNSSDKNVLHSK